MTTLGTFLHTDYTVKKEVAKVIHQLNLKMMTLVKYKHHLKVI